MTRERGLPDRKLQRKLSRLPQNGQHQPAKRSGKAGQPLFKVRATQSATIATPETSDQQSASPPESLTTTETSQPPWVVRLGQRSWRFITHWKTLLALAFISCGGSSVLAIAYIFQLPGLPNCPAVFWPLASASMRFECARIAASKENAKDLLEAISLVDGLPQDHPMREEANRLVELWSQEVLNIADDLFQQGKLNDAITAARQIPAKVTAAKLVEDRINQWQSTWAKAEDIYRKAEAAMRKRDWKAAFGFAIKLLDLNNKYWQTTQYDELNKRINISREDGNKLYEAERLADGGNLDELLKAVKLAEEIRKESYVYDLAQKAIPKFGKKMLTLAEAAITRRNLQDALNIVSKIPKAANLDEEIKDFTIMANAQSQVWQDTVAGLEAGISQAQRITPNRPLYKKAQQLILRWQYEIEGLAQLERARTLAVGGGTNHLAAAISAAALIPQSNPRWNQAQSQIQTWRSQIQTAEDRPLLDQADQLASQGDLNSLQAAIAQANQVAPGRALSGEAQTKMRQWRRQMQTLQDQPYLDQAQAYAQAGNLRAAIAAAGRIQPGRALYDQAQTSVANWQGQLQAEADRVQAQIAQAQAQRMLQDARQTANGGNSSALGNAIQMVSQISASGSLQTEINAAIDEWSWQLLQLAKDQSGLNPATAIAIAQKIPSRAAAHAEAQTQIENWKQLGKPLQ
jgi:soluble cytochrome b562